MAGYTLTPESTHGITKKAALQQLLFFGRAVRNVKMTDIHGFDDLKKTLNEGKRWGVMETSTLAGLSRRHHDQLGLVDDDGERTFGQWWEDVYNLGKALREKGIDQGDNIAVMALNGRAAIYPLCVRHLIGFNIFMINANSSGDQIEKLLQFHDIDTLIVDQEFLEILEEDTYKHTIIIGHVDDASTLPEGSETLQSLIDGAPSEDNLREKPERGAHIVMTSGTTGMPKGVIRGTVKSPQGVAPVIASVPWKRGQVFMLTGVLFHTYGWGNLMIGLMMGVTIVVRRHADAPTFFKDQKEYGISAMATSAARLREIVTYARENGIDKVDGMEWITSSGSPLTKFEVVGTTELFGRILVNFYGSSETSATAISKPGDIADDHTMTGRIYPGTMVEIRDDEGNLLPDGEIGLVYVGCYDMFVGYTDPKEKPREINGLINMGDRGYRKGDRLWVLGRADDLVITQYGEKIFPKEIEDHLIRRDEVADVFVEGVTDPTYGQALRCYIIREEGVGKDFDEEKVKAILTEGLSKAHAPRDVFFVADFPRNPMGKVIKPQLPGKSTV